MSERGHAHAHGSATGKNLLLALALTLGFSVVELIAGWHSGSLALLADAGHMVTDGASLGLSALAAWLAARPPSRRHTYGLGRVEFLAALINALSMVAVVFVIGSEAWQRLQHPGSIDGATVSIVAVLGLLINLVVAWVLSRGERNLNVRAAMLHVMGDALGSVAAIAAGVVIWLTGWTPIDPLLSILIGGLILASSVGLLREALHATLDGVPFTMNIDLVGQALAAVPGVSEVHDLHVWPIASERLALSAHVLVDNLVSWPQTLHLLRAVASDQGIDHVTFQPESPAGELQPIQFVRR
ncbi:cation diffusion facilitator family transporter [Accumulibacter sp.]|uniref:cation diffusion facilitator family transporter n=1 Tax=Accumulibacter sp. TaxID=2053492 RepID=UPI0035B28497